MRIDPLTITVDDEDPWGRLFVVTHPITYSFSELFDWSLTVPLGFKTDLASLPPVTRHTLWLFGQQHNVNSAALAHDYLYAVHGCSRAAADAIFYQELRESGVPRWQAKILHSSVKAFGWRAYNTGPKRLARNSPQLMIPVGTAPNFEGVHDAAD